MALMRVLQSQVTSLMFSPHMQQQSLRKSTFVKCSMKPLKEWKRKRGLKISVIGAGKVGTSICSCLLLRNLTKHLVIMDVNYKLVQAETLDFQHGSALLGDPLIQACGDGSHTKDSDLVIMTAGARPAGKDRSRLAAMQGTLKIFESVVPKLVKLSPNAIFLIVSNPADVMTYAFQRIGKLPKHRVLTTGCHLDSIRFRMYIAERLKPALGTRSNGYVIGEHGASAVPVWSCVSVGGIRLDDVIEQMACGEDPEKWAKIREKITTAGVAVGTVKGYTNWAVAVTTADVVEALTSHKGKVLSVGTDMQGFHGLEHHVVLSLPCLVTEGGISHVFQLPLTDVELKKLHASAETLLEAQCSLKL